MSRFFSPRYSMLEAYTPGEQPKDMKYVKLNTNESPYPPSPLVTAMVEAESKRLNLYSDPESRELTAAVAELYNVGSGNVLMTNGSDEVLNFAFMAFCDDEKGMAFPAVSYGFYPVFAQLNRIPFREIPLRDDFSIDVDDYCGIGMNIVIANPNAPTGLALGLDDIEKIVSSNRDSVVIIDEAYIDFGAQSAVELTKKYDNLLVTQTFSKSRSLAGARLGFGIGSEELINDLNTIKYSTNPYNINRMTSAAGIAAVKDNGYYMANCKKIEATREYMSQELKKMGFAMTDSKSNFLFARSDRIGGEQYYLTLKSMGILVRHFSKPEIDDYVRITVGTREQADILLSATEKILGVN
ncbi:MAG: histidinol-phosphate transaminase [Clostridia bacterium]|nr:histidinol-phosphate transaminase [Clostridia bacterium]